MTLEGKMTHRLVAAVLAATTISGTVKADPAAEPAKGPPKPSAAALAGYPSEVPVLNTRRIDFVSKVNGRRYSIDVALPDVPPPAEGYPVIYVFDGYRYFAAMTEAVRANGNFSQAIVVGISYPRDPAYAQSVIARRQPLAPDVASWSPFRLAENFGRMYDMTPPNSEKAIEVYRKAHWNIEAGGLDDFLKTIETEIKPRVYALAPVNKADQTLFGHSLGGLAVVGALFTEPAAFRTFVAASPSTFWSDFEILKREPQFEAAIAAGTAKPRVLFTVGEQEGPMVDYACDLAAKLKIVLHDARDYDASDCVVFKDQQHGISVWPAIGRAVQFASAS
jgi:predicted alpha/beta superfamily hydrolase